MRLLDFAGEPMWQWRLGPVVLRCWRRQGAPFLSRRYCLLNGGAFGWAFMLMRNYKGANHA